MSLQKLLSTEAADITFEDIITLITEEAEEGTRLELKRELSANQGQRDPWMTGGNKVNSPAKDDLAKEIVALANAYGGIIVVGVDETETHPKRAKGPDPHLIPRVADCADRLNRAFLDMIDPPLRNLDVKGIAKPDGDGSGVILLKVGTSARAPHGYGRPPRAYVRRGANSDPMTMQDVQNMLFETRTRGERVTAMRSLRSNYLAGIVEAHLRENLRGEQGRVNLTGARTAVRCTAIPVDLLRLDTVSAVKQSVIGRPSAMILQPELGAALGERSFQSSWRPCPGGAEALESQHDVFNRWYVGNDGLVEAAGLVPVQKSETHGFVIRPAWFVTVAAQIMGIVSLLRDYFSLADLEYVIDMEFINPDGIMYAAGGDQETGRVAVIRERRVAIGPYSIAASSTFDEIFRAIQQDVWNCYRLDVMKPAELMLDEWLKKSGYRVQRY